jgi:hypothetical protein
LRIKAEQRSPRFLAQKEIAEELKRLAAQYLERAAELERRQAKPET